MKRFIPYFDAEYSYTNYKIPDFETEMETYLGFSFRDDSLMLMNNFGTFERMSVVKEKGNCEKLTRSNIFDLDNPK